MLTVHLARAVAPGGKVVATDIENAVLDLLRNRLDRAKLSGVVEPRVVEADTPGLEPASYDVILLSEVDHYFSDPEAWLGVATREGYLNYFLRRLEAADIFTGEALRARAQLL